MVNQCVEYKELQSVAEREFQATSVSIRGTPVVGAYIQPNAKVETIKKFETQIKRLARGSSVVIGDLNARHKNWDTTTTVQGRRLNAFCAQANFKVLSPPEPSCRTAQGRSYVDLALVRNLKQKDITVYDVEGQSDHAPVKYELLQSEPQDVDFIPLNLVQNHEYQRRANWAYWSTLPDLIEPIEKSSSPEELTKATFDFAKASLAPWAALRRPRPKRWRPGWSKELDKLAKQRSKLLKRTDVYSKTRARLLDKQIKQIRKQNIARIQEDIGDRLEESVPGQEAALTRACSNSAAEKTRSKARCARTGSPSSSPPYNQASNLK